MFLATTADQRFWKTNETILFLGEWCRLYEKKTVWSQLGHEVLPHHWNNQSKLKRDAEYLENLYQKTLTSLVPQLNQLHDVNYSDKYSFIIACNTIHIGKGMKMAPKALLNDGKMDLVIVKNNFSRLKLLQMLPKIFSGEHINSTLVEYLQVQNFEIKSANGDTLNIDGENIGRLPVKIRVKKEAISIQI